MNFESEYSNYCKLENLVEIFNYFDLNIKCLNDFKYMISFIKHIDILHIKCFYYHLILMKLNKLFLDKRKNSDKIEVLLEDLENIIFNSLALLSYSKFEFISPLILFDIMIHLPDKISNYEFKKDHSQKFNQRKYFDNLWEFVLEIGIYKLEFFNEAIWKNKSCRTSYLEKVMNKMHVNPDDIFNTLLNHGIFKSLCLLLFNYQYISANIFFLNAIIVFSNCKFADELNNEAKITFQKEYLFKLLLKNLTLLSLLNDTPLRIISIISDILFFGLKNFPFIVTAYKLKLISIFCCSIIQREETWKNDIEKNLEYKFKLQKFPLPDSNFIKNRYKTTLQLNCIKTKIIFESLSVTIKINEEIDSNFHWIWFGYLNFLISHSKILLNSVKDTCNLEKLKEVKNDLLLEEVNKFNSDQFLIYKLLSGQERVFCNSLKGENINNDGHTISKNKQLISNLLYQDELCDINNLQISTNIQDIILGLESDNSQRRKISFISLDNLIIQSIPLDLDIHLEDLIIILLKASEGEEDNEILTTIDKVLKKLLLLNQTKIIDILCSRFFDRQFYSENLLKTLKTSSSGKFLKILPSSGIKQKNLIMQVFHGSIEKLSKYSHTNVINNFVFPILKYLKSVNLKFFIETNFANNSLLANFILLNSKIIYLLKNNPCIYVLICDSFNLFKACSLIELKSNSTLLISLLNYCESIGIFMSKTFLEIYPEFTDNFKYIMKFLDKILNIGDDSSLSNVNVKFQVSRIIDFYLIAICKLKTLNLGSFFLLVDK